MARKTPEEKKKLKKERKKKNKEIRNSLVFVSSEIKVEDLDSPIVDGRFVVKKCDRLLVMRYDVYDSELGCDTFTPDVCTVQSVEPPNMSLGDFGEKLILLDDSRGDQYGMCAKNPPPCGILKPEHFAVLGSGKKPRKKRDKVENEQEDNVEEMKS